MKPSSPFICVFHATNLRQVIGGNIDVMFGHVCKTCLSTIRVKDYWVSTYRLCKLRKVS